MALSQKVAEQPAKKATQSNTPFFQAKLTVNEPGDAYEQEADAVADKVMRMPTPSVSDSKIHLKPIPLSQISRKCADCEKEEKVQRKESTIGGGQTAPSIVHDVISSSGQSLDKGTRHFMESRMGHDFSNVQVHIDRKAAESAASVNALAYTSGNHIVFNSGQYQPSTEGGKRLLAHELVHVGQQKGKLSNIVQRDPIAVAELGVAVFEAGRSILSGGDLSHSANIPSYMHENTPASATWTRVTRVLKMKAWHPRLGISNPSFYFRLTYEINGYDIREAQIVLLRDRSSSMYSSSFSIIWDGQKHSRPTEPRCAVIFNISGRWDPVGRGDFSFWGNLLLTQNAINFQISAEQNSVWHDSILNA